MEVVTEFIDPPQPVKTERNLSAGQDEELSFGGTIMGLGKAFATGADDPSAPVLITKNWIEGERTLLTESIFWRQLARLTAGLPDPQAALKKPELLLGSVKPNRVLPAPPGKKARRRAHDAGVGCAAGEEVRRVGFRDPERLGVELHLPRWTHIFHRFNAIVTGNKLSGAMRPEIFHQWIDQWRGNSLLPHRPIRRRDIHGQGR